MSPSAAAQRRAAGSEALRSRQSLARPVVEEADGGGGDAEDGAAWRMCSNGPSGVLHIGANEARGSRQRRRGRTAVGSLGPRQKEGAEAVGTGAERWAVGGLYLGEEDGDSLMTPFGGRSRRREHGGHQIGDDGWRWCVGVAVVIAAGDPELLGERHLLDHPRGHFPGQRKEQRQQQCGHRQ